jgi:tRNA nucleotidyltransferase (CCA-adding enzyme)
MAQNDDGDDDVDMTPTSATLPIDTDKVLPIERDVNIVVVDDFKNSDGIVLNTVCENSFENDVLKIELNPKERQLFETLKGAATAWEKGKLSIGKKSVQIRVAGGWVRDKILGLETHDVDIALDACTGVEFANAVKEYHTSIVQDETEDSTISSKAKNNKIGKIGVIAANPAQSKHLETACVTIFGNDVDFSNLRHETYADDSRIPDTVVGTPLEDSFRRDCTMNALYFNLNTERVEDWTRRGLQDLLKTKVIHTPLKAFETFQDDPLRVLRVIRFAVRYQMQLSEEITAAFQHPQIHQALLRKVSRERVGNELEGMLSGKHANPIQAMNLICGMKLADSVFYPPDGFEIMGTIGQARLEPIPYMRADVDENELFRLRESAWEETRECLQVLSILLDSFDSNVNAATTIDRRHVYLTIVLLPYVKLYYIEKQRQKSVVDYMMRDGIKFKNKDTVSSGLVIQNLDDMILLLQQFQETPIEVTSSLRLQAGLLLRSAKEMWVTTLIVATVCLSRKEPSSQDLKRWFACANELYKTIIVAMNLDECWKTKPLMNGKDLIRLLELDRGPVVGVYMQEQVKWVLINPERPIEELHIHLKQFKTTRELGSDDVESERVSKKMHLDEK